MAKRKGKKPVQLDLWGDPIEDPKPTNNEVVPCIFDDSVTMQAKLINGEWWFRAKDPCDALGYTHVPTALSRIPDNEKMTVSNPHSQTGRGGARSHSYISEPGLYRLVLGANVAGKPNVERFQNWVLHEVLPSLRKTGTYSMKKSKTRIECEQKRLGCDTQTAKARVEAFEGNKSSATRLAEEGAIPRDYQAWHDAAYRGEFQGLTARELRTSLGMARGTPLDRMDAVPLSINNCSKALAERYIKECKDAGKPLSFDEQNRLLETVARDLSERELVRFGPQACFGITEDPKRGRIIDVVRVNLGIAQSA